MRKVVFSKYNSTRKPEFRISTVIFDENSIRKVAKKPLGEASKAHVESLKEKSEAMGRVYRNIEVLVPEMKDGAAVYPFLTGISLDEKLKGSVDDLEQLIAELTKANDTIFDAKANAECSFTNTEAYMAVFGIELPEGTKAICPSNADMLYDNLMYEGDMLYCMDCEWVFDFPLPVEFLKYRALSYFYGKYSDRIDTRPGAEAFLGRFGITAEMAKLYAQMEVKFQQYVRGCDFEYDDRRLVVKKVYTSDEIKAQQTEYRRIADTHHERESELEKELENRANHIHKLDEQIKEMSETDSARIAQLSADIAYLNDLAHHKDLQIADRSKYAQDLETIVNKMRRNPLYRAGRIPAKIAGTAFPRGTRRRKILGYVKHGIIHPSNLGYYMSEKGRNDIYGDIMLGDGYLVHGRAELPYYEDPQVSIVIPAYNQVTYTYNCLHSIIRNTKDVTYEVILADDVSTDATTKIDHFTKNLVVSRNTKNMGFLKNCNQAAAKARGRYILFLNNDTQVGENWLKPLVDLMEKRPDAGMTGSKLVYPDGRLQEAGGIIWKDGSGWNYGRMQDPIMPEYNYVKEVDYISGASVMIRTSLWKEIGGFDERFAPAYYEDTDLAFEVRRRGYKVYYQPLSVVTHFEGVSNGTDLTSGLKKYQVENAKKFREKWAEVLERDHASGPEELFLARDRAQNRGVVLFIDHYVPQFDKDAGSRSTFAYVKAFLKQGYAVKFMGDNFNKDEPYTGVMQQMGVEVIYGDWHYLNWRTWLAEAAPMIDIAFMERPHITIKYIDFFREHSKGRIIYYGHDLHYIREMREYELTGKEETKEHAMLMKEQEYECMHKSDVVYYPSYVEVEEIARNDASILARAIPVYVYDEPNEAPCMDSRERKNIMFIGGFAHAPNKDGVLWFLDKVFPKILEKYPDIVFTIMGSHTPDEIKALECDNIHVKGFVTDEELEEAYKSHRIAVVPLRYGAGMKGKVIEAMYNKIPLVTTPIGAEGLKEYDKVMRVHEDADAFADCVISLYEDYAQLNDMVSAMPEFIEKYFSLNAAMNIISQDMK